MSETPVTLSARDLSIDYRIGKRWLNVINDVSLDLRAKQTHGLVGESASGKSTLALALMRYLADNGRIRSGSIRFGDRDLTRQSPEELRSLWGSEMCLVPQNALSALNPSYTIGEQMGEVTRAHLGLSRRESWAAAAAMLSRVKIADAKKVLHSYPYQLSGGMLQRVAIGMALSASPQLLVLDEPTTALDVTTQAVILDLFRELIDGQSAAALYVSHDLGTVAQFCDEVTVLYGGEVVENAPVRELYAAPKHPYTQGLLASLPAHANANREARLATIGGVAPGLAKRPTACVFAPRCAIAIDRCHAEKPPLEAAAPGHNVRCFRWRELAAGEIRLHDKAAPAVVHGDVRDDRVLDARDIHKSFDGGSIWQRALGRKKRPIRAVDSVSLTVQRGQTLGIVGESGSGKSSLARVLLALETADSGEIELLGSKLAFDLRRRSPENLREMRFIPQNPDDTLNPYLTVGAALERTLKVLERRPAHEKIKQPAHINGKARRRARVRDLLLAVGLDPSYTSRYPNQLSGGEKQRVAIARAFASEPALILADEPTSSLDVSVQAVVLNLLKDLRTSHGASYIVISHDMEVIRNVADWVLVMYLGQVVESGSSEQVRSLPSQPYTEALLSAIPVPDPLVRGGRIRLEGDLPSARDLPSGCRFHTRCPRKIGAICEEEAPPWRRVSGEHYIRCHIEVDELRRLQSEAEPEAPA